MHVGVISDVHSNLPALEAVLDDMPPVETLVCAGDVVGYGPWPAECVDALAAREVPTVMGNHDRAVVTDTSFSFNTIAGAGVEYAREELDDDQIAWLRSLPTTRREFEGRVRLVHGHPDDPDRYVYPRLFSPDLLRSEDVLVMGHTHVQAHERYDEGVVMNPGSVGQPRDGDPRAAYAVLDLDADPSAVEEHRVEYDVEHVVETVRETELPEKVGTRLRKGR